MDLKQVVIDILQEGGPWDLKNLIGQVKENTNYQKGVDYDYYVRKYVDELIHAKKVWVENNLHGWDDESGKRGPYMTVYFGKDKRQKVDVSEDLVSEDQDGSL